MTDEIHWDGKLIMRSDLAPGSPRTVRAEADIQRDIDAVTVKIRGIATEAAKLYASADGGFDIDRATAEDFRRAGEKLTPGQREAQASYQTGVGRLADQRDALRAELQASRHAYIRRQFDRAMALPDGGGLIERSGTDLSPSRKERPVTLNASPLTRTREQAETTALRYVDQYVTSTRAQDRLDAVIRDVTNDPAGIGPAYLAAVGAPAYARAFGRILADPQYGHLGMDAEEVAAVRAVQSTVQMRAALTGTGTTGGIAVPFTFDPTIILTDDGAASTLRDVARVVTIATNDWKGIAADSVEATYEAELTQVGDDTPTMTQPEATTEKAQAWIEYSIEIGQDFSRLTSELGRALQSGKDNVEADKFVNGLGHGSFEPEGIYAGLLVGDITGTGLSLDNLYELQAALPPRFQANARWLLNLAAINDTARLVASGDATEPQIISGERLLRKPFDELSTMPAGTVIYGDIRAAFTIIDRIGMAIEPVQHVFGANNRPTGKRGLYAYWRNTSLIVNHNALRAIGTAS